MQRNPLVVMRELEVAVPFSRSFAKLRQKRTPVWADGCIGNAGTSSRDAL